ncbi:hypothetical protein [uncultured Agrococcus sp.]|uniref:hypothetical protein n=1 Tax=uncultured Agrococcus sp. TaxID=382258 RepID=UPI0025F819B4|nr:hypothetical protein [uncultured Agrococcus sp.]
MSKKTGEAATNKAQDLVRAQLADAKTEAFVDDGMLFLTATIEHDGEKLVASHAYTLDSMRPEELDAAARDVADRVLQQLQGRDR